LASFRPYTSRPHPVTTLLIGAQHMPITLQLMATMLLPSRTHTIHPRVATRPVPSNGDYPTDGGYAAYPPAGTDYPPPDGDYGEMVALILV
jgi:hypothetical protein